MREQNRVLVEYALGGNTKPISVAESDTRLTHALPEELQTSLPTVEQIEAELSRDEVCRCSGSSRRCRNLDGYFYRIDARIQVREDTLCLTI